MLQKLLFKPVLTLLFFGVISMGFVNKENSTTIFSCSGDILVENNTTEDITKVIADDSPNNYDDLDDVRGGTQQTITNFSWGSGFTLYVKFNYQPTVGNRIRIYDQFNNIIDCQLIQSSMTDYIFTISECDDIKVVYEAGTTCP
jgi:hypothetical protein